MRSQPVNAAIALGSNLGDRFAILDSAVKALAADPNISVLAEASVVESPPMLPMGTGANVPEGFSREAAVADLGGWYLNSAVTVRTTHTPRDLLDCLHRIERAHGRRRTPGVRWEPRTLDLDLLLYGDEIINEPGLRVPHPGLRCRSFVLGPLAEIAPGWVIPCLNRTAADLLEELRTLEGARR